jgi:predicted RNA binding protein YcfA (HicA-like mRNA interferase family)
MPNIPVIKARTFYNYILKYGCRHVSIAGSHHKVMNPENNLTSVIAIHGGKDLKKALFSKTLRDLDIDIDDFLDFLQNN